MKSFFLTCLGLLALTVLGVRTIAWIDRPKELPLLVDAAADEFKQPFIIGAELCPYPFPPEKDDGIDHT